MSKILETIKSVQSEVSTKVDRLGEGFVTTLMDVTGLFPESAFSSKKRMKEYERRWTTVKAASLLYLFILVLSRRSLTGRRSFGLASSVGALFLYLNFWYLPNELRKVRNLVLVEASRVLLATAAVTTGVAAAYGYSKEDVVEESVTVGDAIIGTMVGGAGLGATKSQFMKFFGTFFASSKILSYLFDTDRLEMLYDWWVDRRVYYYNPIRFGGLTIIDEDEEMRMLPNVISLRGFIESSKNLMDWGSWAFASLYFLDLIRPKKRFESDAEAKKKGKNKKANDRTQRQKSKFSMKDFARVYDGDEFEIYDPDEDTFKRLSGKEFKTYCKSHQGRNFEFTNVTNGQEYLFTRAESVFDEFECNRPERESMFGKSTIDVNRYPMIRVSGESYSIATVFPNAIAFNKHTIGHARMFTLYHPDVQEIELPSSDIKQLSAEDLVYYPRDEVVNKFLSEAGVTTCKVKLSAAESGVFDAAVVSLEKSDWTTKVVSVGLASGDGKHTCPTTFGKCGAYVVRVDKGVNLIVGLHTLGADSNDLNGYGLFTEQDITKLVSKQVKF